MTAPNPRQFERACDQTAARIRQRLADLPALYDHAHGASHERVARGSTGKITHGTNDPTAAIVGDRSSRTHPAHEVVHQCPPGDEALMPCCGLSPFEVPPWHRITITETVTCPAALAPPTTEDGATEDGEPSE